MSCSILIYPRWMCNWVVFILCMLWSNSIIWGWVVLTCDVHDAMLDFCTFSFHQQQLLYILLHCWLYILVQRRNQQRARIPWWEWNSYRKSLPKRSLWYILQGICHKRVPPVSCIICINLLLPLSQNIRRCCRSNLNCKNVLYFRTEVVVHYHDSA